MATGWWACFVTVGRRGLVRCAAALALGVLVGASGATVRLGREVDQLVRQRDRLEQQVADLQGRLRKLEESMAQRRRRPVRATAVNITGLDPADELQLRRRVQELLAGMVGREADQVDPALVAQILDGRLVSLGSRTVHLALKSVWVTDTLTVALDVRAAPER